MKICKDCQGEKEDEDFYRKENRCKSCRSVYNKTWKQANPEKVRAQSNAYYHAHPEYRMKASGYARARYQAHGNEIRARIKAYEQTHKEEIRIKKQIYGQAHTEENRARCRAYRLAHLEERRTKEHVYRKEHGEAIRARARAHYQANAEDICTKTNAYYFAHHDEIRMQRKVYREANPEKIQTRKKAYYQGNAEQIRGKTKAYRQAHPEIDKMKNARRRANKAHAPLNDFTHDQWLEILAAHKYRCVYCPDDCEKCRNKTHEFHQEHLTPVVKNGSYTLANILPSCQSCNSRKHTGPVLKPVQPMLLTIAPARKHRSREKTL